MLNSSNSSNSHFTISIRPIPRGISREDLVADHLLQFGQIKNVRFGEGPGVSGDIMYVDYFEPESAISAVAGLNGTRDPGLSRLSLAVALTAASGSAIDRLKRLPCVYPRKPVHAEGGSTEPVTKGPDLNRPSGPFKLMRSTATCEKICVIDFKSLGI